MPNLIATWVDLNSYVRHLIKTSNLLEPNLIVSRAFSKITDINKNHLYLENLRSKIRRQLNMQVISSERATARSNRMSNLIDSNVPCT